MIRVALVLTILGLVLPAHARAQDRALTEDVRIHRAFPTKHLAAPRDLVVCLPPGYDADDTKRYPVLYMHDGSNVYVAWRLDETVKKLVAAGTIEPVILVLIPNGGTHESRFDDYTPTKPANAKAGGKADAYGRMVVEEVKPFIDETYRTLPDRQNTALGGASLGALVSLYLGLEYPGVFGKLAIVSPAVWWDGKWILRKVRSAKTKPDTRLWLDVGTGEPGSMIAGARELRDVLRRKGWVLDEDLKYFEAKDAGHDEPDFAMRAENILTFFFPRQGGSS